MCIIFIIPAITERGNTGMSMLYIVLFFESIIFPTIVALGMRGLGKYSKRGSGFIVAGVAGGAVVPPLLFVASDAQGQPNARTGHAPTATAMVVPLAFFIAAWTYPFAVNFISAYRNVADSFSTTKIGIANPHANDPEKVLPDDDHHNNNTTTTITSAPHPPSAGLYEKDGTEVLEKDGSPHRTENLEHSHRA